MTAPDVGWEARMAERARARRTAREAEDRQRHQAAIAQTRGECPVCAARYDPFDVEIGTSAIDPGSPRPGSYALALNNPTDAYVQWEWKARDRVDYDTVIHAAGPDHTVRIQLRHDDSGVLRLRFGTWEEDGPSFADSSPTTDGPTLAKDGASTIPLPHPVLTEGDLLIIATDDEVTCRTVTAEDDRLAEDRIIDD